MKLKRKKSVKRVSEKGKLIKELDGLHLRYLKWIRKNENRCEICGKYTDRLGRFHILRVGRYPRLRYVDRNVLLTGWFCCHYPHHHYGFNDPRVEYIETRIKQLRGENYKDELLYINTVQPKQTMLYLQNLKYLYKRSNQDE